MKNNNMQMRHSFYCSKCYLLFITIVTIVQMDPLLIWHVFGRCGVVNWTLCTSVGLVNVQALWRRIANLDWIQSAILRHSQAWINLQKWSFCLFIHVIVVCTAVFHASDKVALWCHRFSTIFSNAKGRRRRLIKYFSPL